MKGIEKSLRIFLICALFFMQMNITAGAVETVETEGENLKITVDKCNVIVKVSDDDSFHFDYDKNIYNLEFVENGSDKEIKISKAKDVSVGWSDFFKVYIPEREYKLITVKNEGGGISLSAVNADIDINVKSGAMSVKLPKNYKNTLNYTAERSSGSIGLSGNSNFDMTVKLESCAFVVPKDWQPYRHSKEYNYSCGNKEAKINVNLVKCSFTIN